VQLFEVYIAVFDQIVELVCAMTFVPESKNDMSHVSPVWKLRFRTVVIAVLAANRLVRWSSTSCRLGTVDVSSVHEAAFNSVVCIGDVQCGTDRHTDTGNSVMIGTPLVLTDTGNCVMIVTPSV